jgi:hypothetical protein
MDLRTTLALLRIQATGVKSDVHLPQAEAEALFVYLHELEKLAFPRDFKVRRDRLLKKIEESLL